MRALPIQNIREEVYPPAAANLIDHIDGVEGSYLRADLDGLRRGVWPGNTAKKYSSIYMDPPFYTGQSFSFAQPVGERGYAGDKAYRLTHTAYRDPACRPGRLPRSSWAGYCAPPMRCWRPAAACISMWTTGRRPT